MERAAKTRCPFLLKDGAMQDVDWCDHHLRRCCPIGVGSDRIR